MPQEDRLPHALRVLRKSSPGVSEDEKERFHPYHEIFYVSEGRCSVFIGRRSWHLQAGDFAVIPAGVLHKTDYLSLGQNTKYIVSFTPKTARQMDAFVEEPLTADCLRAGRVRVPAQRREAVLTQWNRMLFEYENQPAHAMGVCRTVLCGLLLSIARYRAGEEENDGVVSPENERMQAVADYLTAHAAEDLSLPELAAVFALSPAHLSRTFRKVTGFGIREYLVHTRIQNACGLLLNTELSITEIADRCGFNDSNYFGDAFKKAVGLAPREYRKLAF